MTAHQPRRLLLAPRETATSFVSRLAASNWIDAGTFAIDKATSFQRIIDGVADAFEPMAELGDTIPEGILDWSPIKLDGKRRSLHGHIFPSKVILGSQMRGCPMCLRDAASTSAGPAHTAMAMQGHWLVPHVTLCLLHNHPLVPLWYDPTPYTRFDSAVHLAAISDDLMSGHLDGEVREPTDFDFWVDARLSGVEDGGWLDAHALHAGARFCLLLGSALLRLEDIRTSWVGRSNDWALYQMGYEVARHGEVAIRETLMRIQQLPGTPQDGARKIFPVLYDGLAYDHRDDESFEPFRRILREHILETWPLGPGDELLGEPVMQRRLHSVRTAAQATGVDQRRLRKMLAAAGIVPEAAQGVADAWEIFEAAEAQTLLEDMTTLVPAKEFAELIGASRSQFDLLVQDDILKPALHAPGVKAVWNPADGRAFLDSLLPGAVPLHQAQHGWEHLSKSAQRLKMGPGPIIAAIREGRITRVANHADFEGYAAIYVDHDEVSRILGAVAPAGQSIELFAKSVGLLPPSRLRRLILAGFASATMLRNPRTKAEQLYITEEDAEAFHRVFLTSRTMAKELGRSWQSLGAELRAKGVQAFSPDGCDYGQLYLRSDVAAALH
ncbi:TniQ family protein (plasmid) [Cereibacter azotoformans]|uniref:TniQ family protein n=1 Tax=Cereibacter azotoformans TaxID=43057 RepID=UPI003B21B325